jgi:hypothetical protein
MGSGSPCQSHSARDAINAEKRQREEAARRSGDKSPHHQETRFTVSSDSMSAQQYEKIVCVAVVAAPSAFASELSGRKDRLK